MKALSMSSADAIIADILAKASNKWQTANGGGGGESTTSGIHAVKQIREGKEAQASQDDEMTDTPPQMPKSEAAQECQNDQKVDAPIQIPSAKAPSATGGRGLLDTMVSLLLIATVLLCILCAWYESVRRAETMPLRATIATYRSELAQLHTTSITLQAQQPTLATLMHNVSTAQNHAVLMGHDQCVRALSTLGTHLEATVYARQFGIERSMTSVAEGSAIVQEAQDVLEDYRCEDAQWSDLGSQLVMVTVGAAELQGLRVKLASLRSLTESLGPLCRATVEQCHGSGVGLEDLCVLLKLEKDVECDESEDGGSEGGYRRVLIKEL